MINVVYSHRGNVAKSYPEEENKPYYIDNAIKMGFHVEIDLRCFDEDFYLGHDNPDYKVDRDWLMERAGLLLIHCKNLQSVKAAKTLSLNYFCHTNDPYSLTSCGKTWVHDISLSLDENCIIPLINQKDVENYNNKDKIYGICSDYPILARAKFK